MNQNIGRYYERELAYLGSPMDSLVQYFSQHFPMEADFAGSFAQKYPAEARHLKVDQDQPLDPHAERFIQGFGLLTGRIHHQLDSDFQHINEALLGILYPHLLRPIPSMAIGQFVIESDQWSQLRRGRPFHFPRGIQLASPPVGSPVRVCPWRTGYPVDLWPVRIGNAKIERTPPGDLRELVPNTTAMLWLTLECEAGFSFANLPVKTLRLHLQQDGEIVAALYELLFNSTTKVLYRDPTEPRKNLLLDAEEALSQVGFEVDEDLIPFPKESFVGYRLLTELFFFPKKFHFVDLNQLQEYSQLTPGSQLEIGFFLNRPFDELARVINADMFQLGCTPLINLFSHNAEPVSLLHTQHEYPIVVDRQAPESMEVYSVDAVHTFEANREVTREFLPFYAFRHNENRDNRTALWYAGRKSDNIEGSPLSEVSLVLVDGEFDPYRPSEESISIRTTCSNRDLPAKTLRGGIELRFHRQAPRFPGKVLLLTAPTSSRRPVLLTRKASLWRLLSQTVLNHLPFSTVGIDALKETLLLCAYLDPGTPVDQHEAVTNQLIDGITGFHGEPVSHSVWTGMRVGQCRGIRFTLELDAQKYVGTGTFFFASVLERFLGYYSNANSFSQLQLRLLREEGFLRQWAPRAAARVLP